MNESTKQKQLADKMLSPKEAATILGVSTRFLEVHRSKGDGPSFIRISPRCIRYRYCDLIEWLNQHRVSSTAALRSGQ